MSNKYIHRVIKDTTDVSELEEMHFVLAEKIGNSLENRTDRTNYSLLSTWETEIEERHKNWGKVMGISTGYKTIDSMTKGLVAGEIIVIAGETSHGKTALALNIAERVSKDNLVLFVTLEMTKIELGSRLYHIHGGSLYDLNLLVQNEDEMNWKDIDVLFKKASQDNVGLVIIDHLHYFSRELENVAEDLGRITKEIKKNCIRYNLPCILISHTRKKQGGQKSVGINDLRGSSYIAQDADIVLMIERNEDDHGQLRLTIEKNRNRGFDINNNRTYLEFNEARITEGQLKN